MFNYDYLVEAYKIYVLVKASHISSTKTQNNFPNGRQSSYQYFSRQVLVWGYTLKFNDEKLSFDFIFYLKNMKIERFLWDSSMLLSFHLLNL